MIGFACPACNAVQSAAASQPGSSVRCVKCGQRLRVPAPPVHALPATPAPPSHSPALQPQPLPASAAFDSATCRQCGLETSVPSQGRAVIVNCLRCGTKVFVANARPAAAAPPKAPPVRPVASPPVGPAAPASIPHIRHSVNGVLVEVSGYNFLFPKSCACCGGAADKVLTLAASKSKGVRVVRTTTKAWELPYCSKCLAHIAAADQASGVMTLLVLPAIIAFGLFWLLASFFAGLVAGLITVGSGLPFYLLFLRRARRLCSPSCACLSRGAEYLGWYRTQHRFRFASRPFALAFMLCNFGKLVNVSPEARALLQTAGRTVP